MNVLKVLFLIVFIAGGTMVLTNHLRGLSQYQEAVVDGDFSDYFSGKQQLFLVYSEKCKACFIAREYLDSEGIAYTLVKHDSNHNISKKLKDMEIGVVPVLVSRTKVVKGFSSIIYSEFVSSSSGI